MELIHLQLRVLINCARTFKAMNSESNYNIIVKSTIKSHFLSSIHILFNAFLYYKMPIVFTAAQHLYLQTGTLEAFSCHTEQPLLKTTD
jgi:hypothetical protein